MYICIPCACLVPMETYRWLYGCWDPNLGPLEEQVLLLTTKPALCLPSSVPLLPRHHPVSRSASVILDHSPRCLWLFTFEECTCCGSEGSSRVRVPPPFIVASPTPNTHQCGTVWVWLPEKTRSRLLQTENKMWSRWADSRTPVYKPLFWDEGSQRKEELGEKRKHRWVSQLPQEGKAVRQLKPGPGQLHKSQDLEREDRLSLKFTAFSGKWCVWLGQVSKNFIQDPQTEEALSSWLC